MLYNQMVGIDFIEISSSYHAWYKGKFSISGFFKVPLQG
jgi:hypothetical protein